MTSAQRIALQKVFDNCLRNLTKIELELDILKRVIDDEDLVSDFCGTRALNGALLPRTSCALSRPIPPPTSLPATSAESSPDTDPST